MNSVVVKKSNRKTVSLSVTRDLDVLVRTPIKMTDGEVEKITEKHKKWIEKHIQIQRERNAKAEKLNFSDDELKALKKKAKEMVFDRVRYFSGIMGVKPSGIKITSAATRWGSCSGKNSLCFPWRLALLPQEAADYVILHELCHIRVKNHSKKFYHEIGKVMPDYKQRIVSLKYAQKELGI